jgi:2-aminoadipate transaminase
VFPVEEFAAAADRVLSQHGRQALQYSTTEGYRPLREYLVAKMAAYGIPATPDNVLITSGAQQAIDLIGKLMIDPGNTILTESPTYLGALQSWRAYQAEFVSVPVDDEGLRTDLLEEALCAGPKFMYILPNFQNPGGVTLSLERRRDLIDMADHYGIPIIEDDPYGELRYEGEHLPPLVLLDNERLNHRDELDEREGFYRGNVIYMSTFSKTLAPGLRLGWIVAPTTVVQRAVMAKQGMDLHTSTFAQMVAYEVLSQGGFPKAHVRRIRQVYKERRDVMLAAMERYFPPEVTWTRPQGGLFLWATLPDFVDEADLLKQALERKVAFVPGAAFYPYEEQRNHFRLNFSNAAPDRIEVGIQRLGEAIDAVMHAEREMAFT